MKIKVMIVDDQQLMREGLKTLLELEEDISVIAMADNGKTAIQKLSTNPDIILMDIRMPVMNGVECTKSIKEINPKIKILILTTFDDDEYIIDALKNGAEGYLLKDLPTEKLVQSIRDTINHKAIMQPEIAAKLVSHIASSTTNPNKTTPSKPQNPADELTSREKEILNLIAKGRSNKEIAATLFISIGTVKNYVSSIYDKTGVKDRAKAVVYAIENGYV